jgi:hypothetical protein
VGKPERKRPLGRPMRGWESITFSIQEMRWDGMYWIDLAQNKDKWWSLVNAVINLRVP